MSKSLGFLINSNQGLFKSEAQGRFLLKQSENTEDSKSSVERFMGVPIADNQRSIQVSGYTRWAEYGAKSVRRSGWVYVLDDFGIVAKYKLGYIYNGGSSSVDPKKTELIFSRDPQSEIDPPTPKEVVVDKSSYIGADGDVIQIEGTIVSIVSFDKTPMGYWDSGIGFKTTIKAGDDVIVYWGKPNAYKDEDNHVLVDAGDTVTIKARVKSHSEYKGQKQTFITRPKFKFVELETA